jgi:beta-xylosidase
MTHHPGTVGGALSGSGGGVTVGVGGSGLALGGGSSVGGQRASTGGIASGGPVQAGGTSLGGSTVDTGGRATGGGVSTGGTIATGGASATGSATSAGGNKGTGGATATGGNMATCPSTFSNPVIWEDLPDLEVLRVDDTFYYTTSTFHHSPGAPVLRSYDLVNWEYLSHSVPMLDFDASYDLTNGKRSYVNGIWASSLVYRKSNKTFYWYGCMHNVGGGAMYTSTSPTGPWAKHKVDFCYYDVGLLVDDDDSMYAVYGNTQIYVARLNPDTFTQVSTKKILDSPSNIGALEGSHFLKKDNNYYVFSTQYANGEYVLKSATGPMGTYELKPFAVRLPFAGTGAGGSPHQGNVFNTQNGEWYYMGFNDSYPAGRVPVMAPVTWNADGWPSVTLVGSKWGASYPFPKLPCGVGRVQSRYGKDYFSSAALEKWWEWNHNPDNTKWSAGSGLTLQTATVTKDPYAARNTLTRRMPGPTSTATVELDYSNMKDGDVAGLGAWRDSSAFIAVKRTGGTSEVVVVNNVTMDSSWKTNSTGTDGSRVAISGGKIWLRIKANVRTDNGGTATFFYSTDGTRFTQLGSAFVMKREWQFFLGYRFAILNFATAALGGSVKISSFDLVTP